MVKEVRYFVGDFETTVYKGQDHTEVWASAVVEIGSEDVKIFHSIDDTYDYLLSLKTNIVIWYHNLKFDGAFWLSYLLHDLNYTQAYDKFNVGSGWDKNRDMPDKSIKYSISDRGQWYTITIKKSKHVIEIRDSLKLLPFSVKRIGESFGTKHKKLDMIYEGFRYSGCTITDEEKKYIANDVLVVKEALEIMIDEGHSKLTIGSCCLQEYKSIMGSRYFNALFPALDVIDLPESFKYANADEYVRRSYKGGWCYLVNGKESKIYNNGVTADVNSLYPSVMSSASGSMYPIGEPTFWSGNYIPDIALDGRHYYFIRIKTRFYLRDGYLPTVQIKHDRAYKPTEWLETSDIKDQKTGKYYRFFIDANGVRQKAIVELLLTMVDFNLIKEHYVLEDFEILDGCYFQAKTGIFDEYIDKYRKIKITSKGAKRELAKLFLNNLYGKMATNDNSSFKMAYEKEDGSLGFDIVEEHNKKVGFIAVGSAITSYAREFTIRTAQANYYGKNRRGFIYADTDSIHCDLSPEELRNVPVHDTEFCHWKLESCWDMAYFTRQKTYIEHVTHENLEEVKEPYYNIKCAGMPDRCKHLLDMSLRGVKPEANELEDYTEEELEFLETKRTLKDFDIGLKVPGKLMPKRISGGIILVDTPYEMRG